MKLAILYDFLKVLGGAELVSLYLVKNLPDANLYVSSVNKSIFRDDDLKGLHITSLAKDLQLYGLQTFYAAFIFLLFSRKLKSYDKILFSGVASIFAALFLDVKRKVYYCHTPPRFCDDLFEYYYSKTNVLLKLPYRVLVRFYRYFYGKSLAKMDMIICNSVNVQKRLLDYYGKTSMVIYPPVDVTKYRFEEFGDFYLSTSRLEEYKRVGLIIDAFKKLPNKKLVIASGGSQEAYLRKKASGYNNIVFTGWLTSDEFLSLYAKCLCTIYIAMDEDFGLSPIESMASGKPVISVLEGGPKETIIDGKTGWLLPKENIESELLRLVAELKKEEIKAMKEDCFKRAEVFSAEKFIEKIGEVL